MLNSTPVKSALEAIAELTGRNGKFLTRSYHEDFSTLWGLDGGFERFIRELQDNQVEDLVVIWDNIPTGNTRSIDTTLYLTPVDWAVAFSLACIRIAKNGCNFRVSIVDLNSDSSASAPSVRFIKQYPNRDIMSMPWVRIVRPIPVVASNDQPVTSERCIVDVIRNLFSSPENEKGFKSISTALANDTNELDVVKSIWKANLLKTQKTDDHHAIANLLGPMLLAGTPIKPSQNTSALRMLMVELELYPHVKDSQLVLSDESRAKWEMIFKRVKQNAVKILLLDDQWKDGWGEALCELIGIDYKKDSENDDDKNKFVEIGSSDGFVIKASSSPEWLVNESINAPLFKIAGDNRYKFNLDGNEKYNEILCLDLRLFTGSNIAQEIKFIQDLLRLATSLQKKSWNLSWQEHDKELSEIKEWAEDVSITDKNNDPRYHQALTLLSRIIAEIDMSYPVLIFSSTGRREIAKKFDGYKNLLSEFEKPRFSGSMTIDSVEESREKLLQMLERALTLVEARRVIQRLRAVKVPKVFSENEPIPGHVHVELYIDEYHPGGQKNSDRDNIWVGGCYAMFIGKDKEDAINAAYTFDDALVEHGYTYFSRGEYFPQIQSGALVKGKNDDALTELKSVLASECRPYRIEPVRLKCDLRRDARMNDRTGDHAYREALTTLSELFIYELMALFRMENPDVNVSLSIFAGTRFTEHHDNSLEFIKELSYKYGLIYFKDKYDSNKYLLESMTESTLFPLIDDLSRYRQSEPSKSCMIEIERAVAIKMMYDKGYDGKPKFDKKNYAGRVICRKCHTVHEVPVDVASNEILVLNNDEYYAKVFKVSIDKNGNPYALLDLENSSVADTQASYTGMRSIYVNKRIVKSKSLVVNDNVIARLQLGPRGYEANDLNKYCFNDRYGNDYRIKWIDEPACIHCNDISGLRPEYPGGIYLADQIMNKDFYSGEYRDQIKIEKWGFDEEINENLISLRDSGRSVDAGNRVRGAWLAAKAVDNMENGQFPSLYRLILSRLSPNLLEMSGQEFHELSSAFEKQAEPWDHAITERKTKVQNSSPKASTKKATSFPARSHHQVVHQNYSNKTDLPLSEANDNRKEIIEVINILKCRGLYPKLECKRSNNDTVYVSYNQTEKANITRNMVKIGSSLKGNITRKDDGLYASEVFLITM